MTSVSSKDHLGKFPMNTKVTITMYGTKKNGRVCYTSEQVADLGATMIELPNRIGDWIEVLNTSIELA